MHISLILAMLIDGFVTLSKPISSEHVAGPNGLSGWTVSYVLRDISNQGPVPMRLLIARNGRVIRNIHGRPFVWRWVFLASGRQVAFEAGPLHFAMECVLLDVASGKEVAKFDCEPQPLATEAPDWVRTLEAR